MLRRGIAECLVMLRCVNSFEAYLIYCEGNLILIVRPRHNDRVAVNDIGDFGAERLCQGTRSESEDQKECCQKT